MRGRGAPKSKARPPPGLRRAEDLRPQQPDAVLIKQSGTMSYSDMLKKIKGEIDPKALGVNVGAIRRTRNGELLVVMQKSANSGVKQLQTALAGALGDKATVRVLTDTAVIEVRDVDEATTRDDVCVAPPGVEPTKRR